MLSRASWRIGTAQGRSNAPGGGKPKPPVFEHFETTDATKESLVPMARDSAGVTLYRDELTAWVASFDAYRSGRGGDRQDMLSAWSGVPLKKDRVSGPPVIARRPAISVVGGIQPSLLGELSRDASGGDGFLARFLWDWPEVGILELNEKDVTEEAETAIAKLFAKLRVDLDAEHPEGWIVKPSRAAWDRFKAWHAENVECQEGASPLLASILAKLPSQVLRVALVLHCLWHPDPKDWEVSAKMMQGAIDLVEYHRFAAMKLVRHFAGVMTTTLPTSKRGVAERLLRIFGNSEGVYPDNWIPRSHLSDHIRPRLSPEELTKEIGQLVEQGLVEHRTRQTGGRPADEYRLRKSEDPKKSEQAADHEDVGEEGDL